MTLTCQLLMQKLNSIRGILSESTDLPKCPELDTVFSNPFNEILERTAGARSTVTSGQRDDTVIDVDSDRSVVSRLLAIDVVRIERCVRPADLRLLAHHPLENDATAHWNDVRGAKCPIVEYVCYRQIRRLWKEIQSIQHRDDIAVVYTARSKRRA